MSDSLLEGKRLVITGVLTRGSIAFAAATRAQELGASVVLTSFGRARRLTERAAAKLPDPPDVLELDVTSASDLAALRSELESRWGQVDGVLHAVAFAPGTRWAAPSSTRPWSRPPRPSASARSPSRRWVRSSPH